MATVFTLDEAKQAVLHAVQSVVDTEHRISEADGADLAAAVRGFRDLFDLDEWVLNQGLLKRYFCRFPLCFNPPRPPKTDDEGKSRGGNPPAYCEHGVDEEGVPHDNAQRAKRRRDQLRAQRDRDVIATLSSDPPADDRLTDGSRPVTQAREIFGGKLDGVRASLDRTTDAVMSLIEIGRRATDQNSHYAEIEAIQHTATQNVEEEAGRRIAAERREYDALASVARMADDLAEANAAAAGEAADAQRAREETTAAVAELREVRTSAAEAIARTNAEAAERVEAAEAARDEAVANADRRTHEADATVAAASQAVADAHDERDDAKREVRRLGDAVDELRTAAVAREREFEATVERIRTAADTERAALQSTVDDLRDRLDSVRGTHTSDMRELRASLEQDTARQLAAAQDAAARLHTAELAAVRAHAETLRVRAETAEAEAARLRDGNAS